MVHLPYVCITESICVFLGLGCGRVLAADIQQEEDESGYTESKRQFKFDRDPTPG